MYPQTTSHMHVLIDMFVRTDVICVGACISSETVCWQSFEIVLFPGNLGKAVRLAAKSALAGTPIYMAPEVIQANLSHCARSRFTAFNGKKASFVPWSPFPRMQMPNCTCHFPHFPQLGFLVTTISELPFLSKVPGGHCDASDRWDALFAGHLDVSD